MAHVTAWSDNRDGDVFPMGQEKCPATLEAVVGEEENDLHCFVDVLFKRNSAHGGEEQMNMLLHPAAAEELARQLVFAAAVARDNYRVLTRTRS